jgi:tetratricopeptide (TPR) repeat protein
MRLDQPNDALKHFLKAAEKYPEEVVIMLGIGRLYDQLNDLPKSIEYYKKVLSVFLLIT